MKFLITGGGGFIGRRLQSFLARAGHTSAVTSRSSGGGLVWDPMSGPLPAEHLEGVQVVVNLAGESVGKGRWTDDRMNRIRESRWVGTKNLLEGVAKSPHKPRVFFCASAVGYYGDRGEERLPEDAAPGSDFLAEVCKGWEEAASRAQDMGMKWLSGRFGIVLGEEGGALPEMLRPFKMGFGGPIAGGRQWMSWIHVEDVCGLILHSVERGSLQGPVNMTAPVPVINRDFSHAIGEILGKMAIFNVPYFALRLGVGRFAQALVSSQRCVPVKALATHYVFKYREVEAALRECLQSLVPVE
jgi:uncharacterized protein (TIGR01777 family)